MKAIVSKWAAMGYRIELSGDKIVLEYVGEGDPDPVVKNWMPELTAHKPALKRVLAAMSAVDGDLVDSADDASTVQISAEVFLQDVSASATCSNCGQAQWWDEAGRRICGVCHPEPTARKREEVRLLIAGNIDS